MDAYQKYVRTQEKEVDRYFEEVSDEAVAEAHNKRIRNGLNFFCVNVPYDSDILDLGCRDGRQMGILKKLGFKNLTGVDISRKGVDLALEKGFEVHYGDAQFLSHFLKKEAYDVVIATHVLEHCLNPANVLKEIYMILRWDGFVLIEVPIKRFDNPGDWGHYNNFSGCDDIRVFCQGFEVVKQQDVDGTGRMILWKRKSKFDDYFKEHIKNRFGEIKVWPEDHKCIANHFKHASEFVKISPEWGVLDVGTRDAWSCKYLEEVYEIADCVGLEVLQHYVDYYQRKGRSIIQGDACNLMLFENESFDFILCRHVINLVENPVRALSEMVRVSKKGGVIYVVLSLPGNKRLHYTYVETKEEVKKWFENLPVKVLFFDVNPYRSVEHSLILQVK